MDSIADSMTRWEERYAELLLVLQTTCQRSVHLQEVRKGRDLVCVDFYE
jgi:hypothetical protein